ncbi:MAG TPA: tetratricopeptide repeat protein, partial [Thermodesulfobacteriota bacterium]|nr:tetratricopeptide repeat protein [Thermodesulfobacteriota bacterium]
MQKIFENKRFHLWISGVLILVVFLVYSNTFNASFHFDDTPHIVENYQIRNLGNIPEILKGQRGVTMATFALNYAAGGLNVVGYHIVNISIHAVAAVLAYFLVFLTLGSLTEDETWAKRIAAYSALLFAVHPVQTQSVTYIVQRMESLASLFYLAALLFFIKSAKCSDSGKRIALYAGVAIAYVLGVMSKEIAITLPVIALLYDYYFIAKGEVKGIFARIPVYA